MSRALLRCSKNLVRGMLARLVKRTPPYEYVQYQVEERLHSYLSCGREDVRLVVIVGGYYAYEVDRMLRRYPNARFLVFEASPRYFPGLHKRFRNKPRVTCENVAISDASGEITFHETNLEGSGSILQPSDSGLRDYGMRAAESYTVKCVALDEYMSRHGLHDAEVDLIWCDVQGAEVSVLKGAADLLGRCRAVFLEVALWEPTYQGGCTITDLEALLRPSGFVCVGLGTGSGNGTGNGLWIRPKARGKPDLKEAKHRPRASQAERVAAKMRHVHDWILGGGNPPACVRTETGRRCR